MNVITAYLTRQVMQSGGGSSTKEYVDDLRDLFLNGGSWLEYSKKRVVRIGSTPSPYYADTYHYTNVFDSYDSVMVVTDSVALGTRYTISNGIFPLNSSIIINASGTYMTSVGLWDCCFYEAEVTLSGVTYPIYKYKPYSGSEKNTQTCLAYTDTSPETPSGASIYLFQSSVPPNYTRVPFVSSYPILTSRESAIWFNNRMHTFLDDPSGVTSRDLDDLEDYLMDHAVEPGE